MKDAFRDTILKTAHKVDSLNEFQSRIKFAEEVLVHLDKCGAGQMKKHSKSDIDELKKQFKKQHPHQKITFKDKLFNVEYSVSDGCNGSWHNVDYYTPFQLEQYMIWNAQK